MACSPASACGLYAASGAGAAVPLVHLGGTASLRAVRGRVRAGDRAGGAAGVSRRATGARVGASASWRGRGPAAVTRLCREVGGRRAPGAGRGRVRRPALRPGHARTDRSCRDQLRRRSAAARAPAGGRAAPVLRVEPGLGVLVPGNARGAARRRGRRGARVAVGERRGGRAAPTETR